MANTLRDQIVQQKFYALPQLIFKANYKDVQICLNPNSLLNNYLNHFHKYGEDNCILLSYSNSLVSGYNQNIKNALSNSVSIKEGDVVMSYTKNQLYRVDNSERLVVKKIIESVYQGGVKFLKLRLKSLDNLEEVEAYVYENFLIKNDGSFTNQEFKSMMIDFKKRMDYQNIITKSSEFKEKQKSDPFLNALHLKFGYACTIHKAQGAEWDYVFLAINFNKSNPKYSLENYLNFAKILYTAITRAKKQLFILDGNWILHKF
jgi:superfamily I DNA/RNA helicase